MGSTEGARWGVGVSEDTRVMTGASIDLEERMFDPTRGSWCLSTSIVTDWTIIFWV
jgi:hypothetical protein